MEKPAVPLLELRDVSFSYRAGEPPAVAGVSLGVEQGSILALLGPNGAGKTTLFHLALGWLKPGGGEILLENRDIFAYPRRELGKIIGLVPQAEHIPFEYSLLEYVLLGRTPYLDPLELPGGKDYDAALGALDRVGLAPKAHRSLTSLSAGERQLLMIARSLAQHPRLILLDEPSSHLDPANKGRLVTLLRELSEEGLAIFFTTHDPEMAVASASRLALMSRGSFTAYGRPEEVLTEELLYRVYEYPLRVVKTGERLFVFWT